MLSNFFHYNDSFNSTYIPVQLQNVSGTSLERIWPVTILWCYSREFGNGSTNNPLFDIILYFHHSSAWYCTDILRKNSVLVTYGSLRVNGQLRKNVELTLLRQLLPFLEFYEDILPHHLSHTWSKKWMGNLSIRKTYSPS